MRGQLKTPVFVFASVLLLMITIVLVWTYAGTVVENLSFDRCWIDVVSTASRIKLRFEGPQLPVYEREEGDITVTMNGACADKLKFVNDPITNDKQYTVFWGLCKMGKSYILGYPTVSDSEKGYIFKKLKEMSGELKLKKPFCVTLSKPLDKTFELRGGKSYCLHITPPKKGDEKYFIDVKDGPCEEKDDKKE